MFVDIFLEFSPTRSPGLPNDRYERMLGYDRPLSPGMRSPGGTDLRGVAKALFKFSGHNPRLERKRSSLLFLV